MGNVVTTSASIFSSPNARAGVQASGHRMAGQVCLAGEYGLARVVVVMDQAPFKSGDGVNGQLVPQPAEPAIRPAVTGANTDV